MCAACSSQAATAGWGPPQAFVRASKALRGCANSVSNGTLVDFSPHIVFIWNCMQIRSSDRRRALVTIAGRLSQRPSSAVDSLRYRSLSSSLWSSAGLANASDSLLPHASQFLHALQTSCSMRSGFETLDLRLADESGCMHKQMLDKY